MPEDELNEIRRLIDSMQSGLVELFDQLRELRTRLNLVSENASESLSIPAVLPLFSEIKTPTPSSETNESETTDVPAVTAPPEEPFPPAVHNEPEIDVVDDSDVEQTATSAKVNRVLDPISHELRTGEAPAEIIFEYLQSAREYLFDDAADKGKVARDIDIVLNFLKARGKKAIRPDERDNILKRIRRWKAYLATQSSSPAD